MADELLHPVEKRNCNFLGNIVSQWLIMNLYEAEEFNYSLKKKSSVLITQTSSQKSLSLSTMGTDNVLFIIFLERGIKKTVSNVNDNLLVSGEKGIRPT